MFIRRPTSICRKGIVLFCLCFMTVAAGCCRGSRPRAVPDTVPAQSANMPESLSPCPTDETPRRIILNLTSAPSTSLAVTWRTNAPVSHPQAQIAKATGSADFSAEAGTVDADTQRVCLADDTCVQHHAVIFTSLEPGTRYAYRVGAGSSWSEWNQFQTADSRQAPLTFIYFGDPQEEVRSKCSRVFRTAFQKAPDADFWLFVGDLVDNGDQDGEWGQLFDAFGWIPRTTPMILLPGNHAYPDRRHVQGTEYKLFNLWRPHFTLPENGPPGLEETVYVIDYQEARLVMLNGNEHLKEQVAWLDRVLSGNPRPWTIVAIHQPVYSTGRHRYATTLQDLLAPVLDGHGVDLVLQGHDHHYCRSFPLKGGARTAPPETGTVYVTSVSGPKSYPVNPRHHDVMAKTGTGVQLFQVITIDSRRLRYAAYDAAGVLYDAFELEK